MEPTDDLEKSLAKLAGRYSEAHIGFLRDYFQRHITGLPIYKCWLKNFPKQSPDTASVMSAEFTRKADVRDFLYENRRHLLRTSIMTSEQIQEQLTEMALPPEQLLETCCDWRLVTMPNGKPMTLLVIDDLERIPKNLIKWVKECEPLPDGSGWAVIPVSKEAARERSGAMETLAKLQGVLVDKIDVTTTPPAAVDDPVKAAQGYAAFVRGR